MRIIGITGGIGSGKSTATGYLKQKGYTVLDADQIAREIVQPGSPVLSRLTEVFGMSILQEDGSLNRKLLGRIVFSDENKKVMLDEITHGEILSRIRLALNQFEGETIFIDAPLLLETGMDTMVNEIWVVDTEDELRIQRVEERDGLTRAEIKARMARQLSREDRLHLASHVLHNSGTVAELHEQIERIMGEGR